MTIHTEFALPQEVPQELGLLSMTESRDLAEYVDYLGFRHVNDLLCWLSDCADVDEMLTKEPSSNNIVDLGTGSGIALVELRSMLLNRLMTLEGIKIIGIDKYNFSEKFHKNSHLRNPHTNEQLPGPYRKIQESQTIQLRYGDFTNLALQIGEGNKFMGIYGFFCYGSEEHGHEFGITKQIDELFIKSSLDMCAKITVVPDVGALAAEGKITQVNGNYIFDYDDESFFTVRDPVTLRITQVQIIKLLKQRGFNVEIFQPTIKAFKYIPLPILTITKNLEA